MTDDPKRTGDTEGEDETVADDELPAEVPDGDAGAGDDDED